MASPPAKEGFIWAYKGDCVRFLVDVMEGERIHFNDMLVNGKTPTGPQDVPEWFQHAFGSGEYFQGLVIYSYLH